MFPYKTLVVTVAALLLAPTRMGAQQPTPDASRSKTNWDFAVTDSVIPLKVQVVISRYQGDKKISSVPYTLSVNANDRTQASLRMGAQVPVPSRTVTPDRGTVESFSYRDIGTYIDCSARALDEGRFRLSISIDDSSIYPSDATTPDPATRPDIAPAFRSFKLSNTAVLKDGQSTQFTTATDKLNGETTRIDLMLTVVK